MSAPPSPRHRRAPVRFDRALAAVWALTLLAGALPANAEEGAIPLEWKFSTGFDFSRGDYGLDEDSDLIYVPIGLELTYDRLRAKVTLPILHIDGPTGALVNEGAPDQREEIAKASGLGQIVVSGSYLFGTPTSALPYLELTSKVTIPSETDGDLGTGLWAGAVEVDLFDQFGPVTPFGRVGRKFYEGGRLDDRFYASAGTSFRLHRRLSAGIAYDWLQATTNDSEDVHQLAPFATWRIDDAWSFGPYAVVGLSQGAPDFGFGFSLSVRRRR